MNSDAELYPWEYEEINNLIERWAVLVCDPEAARPLPQNRNMGDDEESGSDDSDDEESESGSDESEEDDTSSTEYVSEADIDGVDASSSGSEQGEELDEGPADMGRGRRMDGIRDRSTVSSPSPASSDSMLSVSSELEFYEWEPQCHEQFLIGHLTEDLFSHLWVCNKRRFGFGDASTESGCGRAKRAIYDREMHLPLLRVCRQMYTEASQVLWETNVFSFNDVASFKHFMSSRTAYQKRSIKNLRLVMDWTLLKAADSWNKALSMSLVKSLQGLRALWLHINAAMFDQDFENPGIPDLRLSASWGFMNGIKNLATLPLTKARVYLLNKDLRASGRAVRRYEGGPWTKQRKRLFARALQAKLLYVGNSKP